MIDFNIPVKEEILYLANAMTEEARKKMFLANKGFSSDAQRKAVMSKLRNGEGGGNGSGISVYEKGEGGGGSAGNLGGVEGSGTFGTREQNSKYKGYLDWYYNGLWQGGTGWVRTMDYMTMDAMAKSDPEKLRSAIQNEINKGTYDKYKINGHTPTVDEVIEHHITPNASRQKVGSSFVAAGGTISNRESVTPEYLANAGFHSDAQRRAVMAKLRNGEGGGSPYGEGNPDWVTSKDEAKEMAAEKYGYDLDDPAFAKAWDEAYKVAFGDHSQAWIDRFMHGCERDGRFRGAINNLGNYLKNRERVQEEIIGQALYLANKELTDEQRKAIFAKNGGGGGGNRQQVYYRGSPNGGSGGNGGSSGGKTGGRTVQTTRNAGSGGGYHYTGAGDLTSSWVTSLSPQQMAEEYKNDPERLKKAIQEQINAGAYMGVSINGHEPSVMDIINGGIAPNYTKPIEVKNLSERDFYAQKNDPMAGAEAVAIDPMTGKPMQEGQGSWEHLSPTQQVEQDITGGTTASGSGTVQPSTTPGGNYTVTPSTGGGTTTGTGDIGGAIETIDLSGNTGGPMAAEIAAANLSAFQQALAHAHF